MGCLMLNCCDYDAITFYQSGQFNSNYKTDMNGKLKRVVALALAVVLVVALLASMILPYIG